MFNNTKGVLTDVPVQIRSYYSEETREDSLDKSAGDTYLVLNSFGETQDNVSSVMLKQKPEDLVNKFLGFANNAVEKEYHDNFLAWFEKEPSIDDSEAHQEWQSEEPVKREYMKLSDYAEYRVWKQMQGVEFEGVMCSATKQDYWGLSGAYEWIKLGHDTTWHFANGNKLLLTKDNIDAFQAVWLPFRLSFFENN